MSGLREGLDRVAGSAADRLLHWASARRNGAGRTWIEALGAEMHEFDTGWSRLRWALGAVRLLWIESRPAVARRWRLRLRWVGSAGGLGGVRVYGPAVMGGVLMSIWSYWHRGEDAPIPLFAAVVMAPLYTVVGFCWARRTNLQIATLVGAVTAVVGFQVVILATAIYATATDPVLQSAFWFLFGPLFTLMAGLAGALVVGFVGAVSGFVGAAVAHPISNARLLRRSIINSL